MFIGKMKFFLKSKLLAINRTFRSRIECSYKFCIMSSVLMTLNYCKLSKFKSFQLEIHESENAELHERLENLNSK